MVFLGSKVRDKITGFQGIVISEHRYLFGCTRMCVQPVVGKDGKLPETATFDKPQLELIGEGFIVDDSIIAENPGGPEKYMPDPRPEG